MSVLHFNAHWSNSGVVLILSNNYYNYALKIYKEILLKNAFYFVELSQKLVFYNIRNISYYDF